MANKKLYTCGSGIDLLKMGKPFWCWASDTGVQIGDYRIVAPEEAVVERTKFDQFQVDPTGVAIKHTEIKRINTRKKVTAGD